LAKNLVCAFCNDPLKPVLADGTRANVGIGMREGKLFHTGSYRDGNETKVLDCLQSYGNSLNPSYRRARSVEEVRAQLELDKVQSWPKPTVEMTKLQQKLNPHRIRK